MLIAPHIHQITLPLPFALNHVHCYLIDDGDGWTILDTGLHTAQAEAGWLAAFAELGITPAQLKRIILTHAHPDHYGTVGWLQQWSDGRAAVYLSPAEATFAQRTWHAWQDHRHEMLTHLLRIGLEEALATAVADNTQFVATRTQPHPTAHHHLLPGQTIELGQRTFQLHSYPGHSDGPLLFYCPAEQLALVGDHILMDITPNISLWPGGEADPLGRYLASLAQLKQWDVALAWSGHKRPITAWHGRLQELEQHHTERLAHTVAAVAEGNETTAEIAKAVFRLSELTVHEARFALTETLAHLRHLVNHGRLTQTEDEQGVWRFANH